VAAHTETAYFDRLTPPGTGVRGKRNSAMGQSGHTITIERCAKRRLFNPSFCATITPDIRAGRIGVDIAPTVLRPINVERANHG